jgi:hypothetical protein
MGAIVVMAAVVVAAVVAAVVAVAVVVWNGAWADGSNNQTRYISSCLNEVNYLMANHHHHCHKLLRPPRTATTTTTTHQGTSHRFVISLNFAR